MTEEKELRNDADGFEDFGENPEDLGMLASSSLRGVVRCYLEKGTMSNESILNDKVPERGNEHAA